MARSSLLSYIDGRLHEWTMATSMILFGAAGFIFPQMEHGSILKVLLQVVSFWELTSIFLSVGVLSIFALFANGRSLKIGPRIRSLTAVIRSVLWMSFTLSMVRVSIEQGFPSPMVFFWGPFTLAEIYIAYRAVLDVRNN